MFLKIYSSLEIKVKSSPFKEEPFEGLGLQEEPYEKLKLQEEPFEKLKNDIFQGRN
jgi:hypothetical protein